MYTSEKQSFKIILQNIGKPVSHVQLSCIPLDEKIDIELNMYKRWMNRGDSIEGPLNITTLKPGKTGIKFLISFIGEEYNKFALEKNIKIRIIIFPK